jgi:hypothetical protein
MKYLIAFTVLLLVRCNSDPSHSAFVSTSSVSHPVPTMLVAPPISRPQVLRGWLRDYDAFIKSEVQEYPKLLKIAPGRLSNFCPGFARIRDKAQFYADLLWSIAGPESDRRRTQITLETNLDGVVNPIDPVTGYQVRSEGLLQLSYQDTVNYNAPKACPFDWRADKAKALAEFSRGAGYGDGTRSIHDAYKNLKCGVFILNAHLSQLYPSAKFEDALRRYWITMDPADPAYKIVRANLKKRQPACK